MDALITLKADILYKIAKLAVKFRWVVILFWVLLLVSALPFAHRVVAELKADFGEAETESQRKQAIRILDGGLTIKTNKISKKITKILADVEAVIDFSDEDLPTNLVKRSKEQIKNSNHLEQSAIKFRISKLAKMRSNG